MDQGPTKLSTAGRPPFFRWLATDKVAWATSGVTVVGLGLGVTFLALSKSADSHATSIAGDIRNFAANDPGLVSYQGFNRVSNPCADPIPVTAKANYSKACGQLKDNMDARDTDKTLGWVGLGLGIAGAAATTALYFVRTKPKKAGETTSGPTVVVSPLAAPGLQGLGVQGIF